MEINQKLQHLLTSQKELLQQYEELYKEFNLTRITEENAALKVELTRFKASMEALSVIQHQLKTENTGLKIALREQMLNEKLQILKRSGEKINTYFQNTVGTYQNSLQELEERTNGKIAELSRAVSVELEEDAKEFNEKLAELSSAVDERIRQRKEQLHRRKSAMVEESRGRAEQIRQEGISEEVLQKRIRQNNMEFKIGLNWINKIGILLIFIAISTGLKFTYSNFFTNEIKGAFVFLLGFLFVAGGEYLVRRERETFALGLTGGGIGILYLGMFHSYFNLKIVDMNMAMIGSVLITAVSIFLALRNRSETIASLSLAGGFFPFFTYVFVYGLEGNSILISMGYLFLLNLLTLFISIRNKWNVVRYLSFLMNVPSMLFLVFKVQSPEIGILYSGITFSMYLMVSLAYPLRYNLSLKLADVILLAINTTISCITIYALFDKANLEDFRGLLAIGFSLIYFALGRYSGMKFPKEKATILLFHLTALTFAVLTVPFQFGVKWLAMGWLIESVLLVVFGVKHRIRQLEVSGWIVYVLCVFSFFTVDYTNAVFLGYETLVPYFNLRYTFMIVGSLTILASYLLEAEKNPMRKFSSKGSAIQFYKMIVLTNVWIYGIYMANELQNRILLPNHYISGPYVPFVDRMLFIAVTMGIASIIVRIPLIVDKLVRSSAAVLQSIAVVALMNANFDIPVFGGQFEEARYLAMATLLFFNVIGFMQAQYIAKELIRVRALSAGLLPIALCIYLLANITGVLVNQFNLGDQNLVFSLLYLAFAFGAIVYGFMKGEVQTRRFGLGLTVFSLAKLFLFDLSFLQTGGKILSYFVFGAVLLAISYLYQKFSNAKVEIPTVKPEGDWKAES